VESADGKRKDDLIDLYGIKGFPMILTLESLSFPLSFPVDIMHIAYINVSKYVIRHFGAIEFKQKAATAKKNNSRKPSRPSYCMSDSAIRSLATDLRLTNETTPSTWGAPVPYIFEPNGKIKSEHWQTWTSILSGCLLYQRISEPARKAWLSYVSAINTASAHTIHINSTLESIRRKDGSMVTIKIFNVDQIQDRLMKFINWFETEVYGGSPQNLHYCRIVFHYLTHIAASVEANGPGCCYWQYPLEKLIGRISPWIQSRRYPYINFNKNLRMLSNLSMLPHIYENFQFSTPKSINRSLFFSQNSGLDEYLHPRKAVRLDRYAMQLLAAYYTNHYSIQDPHIESSCVAWDRATLKNGDRINSRMAQASMSDDGRDRHIVMLRLSEDRLAACRNAPVDMQDVEVVAEVTMLVVHTFNGVSHMLALVKRYNVREESGMLKILGTGRSEWVDIESVMRGLGICTNSASGRLQRWIIDRE
jgi:hypothetical protein